jgi:tetratricopeptide (TPR) repeat protein
MALPLVADYPLVGSGAGTFRHVFPFYQTPSLSGWWKFAHNEYLNTLADGGILALGAVAVAVVFLLKRIVSLRRSRDPTTRAIGVAAFLALATELFHSFADFPLRAEPANAVVLAMVLGVAYGRATSGAGQMGGDEGGEKGGGDRSADRFAKWLLPARIVLALVLCAVCLPVLVRLRSSGALRAEADGISLRRGVSLGREDLARRVRLLERAAKADAHDAESRYEAARTLVRLAVEGISEDEANSAERSYYLEGTLDYRRGRTGSADELMWFASRLAPAWPNVAFNVGRYFLLRWRDVAREGPPSFGLSRWSRGEGKDASEMLARASESLALAVRSRGAGGATIALVLDVGLSLRETDAVLKPDGRIDIALAQGLARRGEHELACDRYERALASGEIGPVSSRVFVSYARSLLAAGRTAEALEQFDKAIAASAAGGTGETIRALAGLRTAPADAAALAEYWSAAQRRLGEEPAALLALARAELASGRDAPAFEHFLEYAKRTGEAGAFGQLAALELERGDLKGAASFARQAARLDPGTVSRHTFLARVLDSQEDLEGAGLALRKALSLEPRNANVAAALARIEMKAGRHDAALSVWRGYLDAGGNEAVARERLAEIHLRRGDRERAAEELTKALEIRPGDARLRKKLDAVRGGGRR